jgi:hypothetical protein
MQRIFDKRVLRGMFVSQRQETKEIKGKLHKKELHDLYYPPNVAKTIIPRE